MNRQSVFSATYRDGAFHPDEPCDLPEGTRVMVGETLNGVSPALEPDPEERRKNMQRLIERMKRKQITGDPPKLTREDLYDRY